MLTPVRVVVPCLAGAALALSACSSAQTPLTDGQSLPTTPPAALDALVTTTPTTLGALHVTIDTETLAYTATPLEPAARHGADRGDVVDSIDVTYYFSKSIFCQTGDCIELTSIGLDDEGGTLTTPLITATFGIRHPFAVATPPITGTGRSRNDLNVQNARGYIVNAGVDAATDPINTGIPLVPPGVANRDADTDSGNIVAYLGPLTGGAIDGLAGYVTNAEGLNNGADGVLKTVSGTDVPEAGLDLFDFRTPTGFGGIFAAPYIEFIPAGDTGDRVLGQGESAEATYKLNAVPGDPTIEFIFALAANYGNSAGPIATDAPDEKVPNTRIRRGAPIYYYPGFNKPEALTIAKDATNSTDGAAGASTPVSLYVDVTDMQAGSSMPATWAEWYDPADEAAVRNVLPPDVSVAGVDRAGYSTVFVLGIDTPSGGGLQGILAGEAPFLIAWDAPTFGGVQRIAYSVIDANTGAIALAWNAANDIEGADIDPSGAGLPGAGLAVGVGSDADGATPAAPLKAHISLPTGSGAGQLPAGDYVVCVVVYDDLIDDGDATTNTLFEESAWNMAVLPVTVAP